MNIPVNKFTKQKLLDRNAELVRIQDKLFEDNKRMLEVLKKVYYEDDCPKHLEMLIEPFIDPSDRFMKDDYEPPMPGQEP